MARKWRFGMCLMTVVFLINCSTRKAPSIDEPSDVVLHLDYRSGGEAPLAVMLTFMESGWLRILPSGKRPRWYQLNDDGLSYLESSLVPELERLLDSEESREFGCCDYEELGISMPPAGAGVQSLALDDIDARSETSTLLRHVFELARAEAGDRVFKKRLSKRAQILFLGPHESGL